jgi:hypothetical protein
MKKVTSKDGIHFVAAGYGNLATRATASLVAMLAAPRREIKTAIHFWRGFKSNKGSAVSKGSTSGTARGRGRGNLRADASQEAFTLITENSW